MRHAPLWGITDAGSATLLKKIFKKMPVGESVVHVHGFRMGFLALAARRLAGRRDIRIVCTSHKVRKGRKSFLFRRIYRNLDAMIFVSQLARNRFESAWYASDFPYDRTKSTVLIESLNIPDIAPKQKERRGPVTAMFHGPVVEGKGLETLIDALSMVKPVRLRMRIVGSGNPDYVDRIRMRAQARGVMEMIDWHKHTDDPMSLIESCDFGVLPSVTEEACGLANLEYMASGRAQICTSNGAQSEYLTDGREALLVPPGNASALADAIRKLASDVELRERMGELAYHSYHDTLTWRLFAPRLEKIYLKS